MNVEDIRAQLESDLNWRTDEIRLLTNQLGLIQSLRDKERFCRTLLVMLYAHVEGFTKICIRIYVQTICAEHIPTRDINPQLRGNCFDALLETIESGNANSFFLSDPPPKQKLTRAYRITELMSRWEAFLSFPFMTDPDTIADTDSNLKRPVLRKMLYRAGFHINEFILFEDDLEALVSRRNPIAHGEIQASVKIEDYIRLETNALLFMEELIRLVTSALLQRRFLVDANNSFPMI